MDSKQLKALPKIPSVHIIISNNNQPVGMVGGECPALSVILKTAVDQFPKEVKKIESTLTPIAQDVYEVSWSYLMSIRGAFSFMLSEDVNNLVGLWPETCGYHVVVTV